MGFGEHDAAGDTPAIELMKQFSDDCQSGTIDRVNAELTQRRRISLVPCLPLATVQIGNHMNAVQFA